MRNEARGLSCFNKNRRFTVIWLWFNNAFKRESKWLIKSGDLFIRMLHHALLLSWCPSHISGLAGGPEMSTHSARSPIPIVPVATTWLFISTSVLYPARPDSDSCLSSSPLPWPFLSSSSSWTMQAEWKCKSHSLLKHLSQGGSMSPIFMSFKWLLSKWGRTKSHPNCHKYKWLDIGCNKPSGKIIWCAVAVMVYHTGSSYISTGKVIRSFRGL